MSFVYRKIQNAVWVVEQLQSVERSANKLSSFAAPYNTA